MMDFTTNELRSITDDRIIAIIGEYIRAKRLEQDYTQEQLAYRAGLNRTTIRDLELGKRSSLITLIQTLRALDALSVLKNFKVTKELSPLQQAKLEVNEKRRASGKGKQNQYPSSDW